MSADLYVVFDGPPGPEAGRFIEVENAYGESVNAEPAEWRQREDGHWVLGPFKAVEATENVTECRVVKIRGNLQRLDTGIVNDAIADIVRGAPRLRTEFFGKKDYDRFYGQRADCRYGMGPSHGHTIVAIELQPDYRRDLLPDEIAEAVEFLTRFPLDN